MHKISEFKKMFPMFKNNPDIIYFDNAALTFKPYSVIEEGNNFYEKYSISTRTADSKLGVEVAQKISSARKEIASLVEAKESEFIFTSGTTESLNQAAMMLRSIAKPGKILLSYFNHSSNMVPWFENYDKSLFKFIFCKSQEDFLNNIDDETSIVSLSQVTNNYNEIYDIKAIYEKCQKHNVILVNDAAQAIVHEPVSINNSDVITFSSNKLFGPTGMGGLVIKEDLINKLSPKKFGGGQVQNIQEGCVWAARKTVFRFEPGTPNLAGIFQFKAAAEFLNKISYSKIQSIEKEVADYLYDKLAALENVSIASNKGDHVVLFNVNGIPAQDIASYLGHKNIYVRSGEFCAYRVKDVENFASSYVRVSISIYNDKNDVDVLINTLKQGLERGDFLGFL
ncbi:aminotransferase class V-fold PLP-dependent enzyme [[Mycoplasma] falconis]|uniref:Aminotransferase class V-fold PLP-dependent enzyme n=1 Tax=[Mycoplasma] falconis TaxID=92403 RepID=A0A501X9M9_9BACT|nr:aminotransferase class V-fold PLP-dependent enzyme [[Mycoplasma] falconis]TPE57073.1 aminotransferase class V-fold PLP-dependent enzyme [[Mycoplasma] falconis]